MHGIAESWNGQWLDVGRSGDLRFCKNIRTEVKNAWEEMGRNQKYLLMVVGFLLGLTLSAYVVWLHGRIIPGVTVSGMAVGGMTAADATLYLGGRVAAGQPKKVILTYQKRSFDVVLGTIGIQPDIPATVRKAYSIGRTGSILRRLYMLLKVRRYGHELRLRFRHNQNILDSFFRLLDASIGVEPARAVVRVDRGGTVRYTPSREGRKIDRAKLTGLFEEAVYRTGIETIDIPVNPIIPILTNADIERWKLGRVLGCFVTTFNPNARERSHNVKLACDALDNVIIYPGQNFSFNTWIGPRVPNNGYKEAPVVYRGKLIPGIGGGVCQVSSTLYNAVLLANLEVVKRYNHSLPSAYVPLGRDATVVNGGLDLIFKNNLKTPILLTAEVDPPYVRVAVLGEKEGWEKVELSTEIVDTYPYKVHETLDPQLNPGEVVKATPGKDGHKVYLWRTVYYPDCRFSKSKVNTSIYPAQPEEYKVGPQPDALN
jgi:vancomycin resistance protein YoaR